MSLRYYCFLCVFLGNPLPHGPPEQVLAFAGEAVILPCSFSPTGSDDFPTVEWSKEDLQPNVVFLYRDGCETYEMKDPLFQYRTSFIPKELKNRNVSLRISNVQLSDAGKYQCKRLWKNGRRDITTVELSVGTSTSPKGVCGKTRTDNTVSFPAVTFPSGCGTVHLVTY
uniref:Ig-like domain-containing protein n=1 Tax=Dicentrarchus labrax TaxID=13489 RepID=A0A8C4FEQ3_DICLA